MAPTRELAEQIHEAIEALGRKTRLKSVALYGGVGINPQIQKLKRTDIVVACPGRLLDHIGRHTIDLSRLEVLVIDEADQLFDMGFFQDIRRILTHLPKKRQAALDGFRDGTFQILVATDIAARGIDVTRVSHVINYDIPSTPEAYIHRIGRTGRATRSGEAFTLVTGDDKNMVRAINRIIDSKIEQRTVPAFDYTAPGSGVGNSPQRQRKSKRNFFGLNKSRSRKTSHPVHRI
jgi:superfamily II DNA/RNA helicase